jgi:hypothetical protein
MRISSLYRCLGPGLGLGTIALFAAGLALADSSPQTATYVDGNVAGVAPKTGGTLLFAGDETMNFRTGLTNVAVPYANISHAELGAVVQTSHNEPFYKVWALHKRFAAKPQSQYLIVNFANEEGEAKTMTLELSEAAAPDVLSLIQTHNALAVAPGQTSGNQVAAASNSKKSLKPSAMRAGPQSSEWWGDDYWKTSRNSDKWGKTSAATPPEQR